MKTTLSLMTALDDAEDLMGDINIEDNVENLSIAATIKGGGAKRVKKTKEHLEAEKNLRGKGADALTKAKRELTKQRRRYKARRITQEVEQAKKKQNACREVHFEKEGGKTTDRQKWKEELKTYSRKKYQDDEMNAKAKKELEEWEERSRRQRWESGASQEKAFERRYIGEDKEEIETWLRNIFVLIPKKKVIDRLEGQTRGICVQRVLAKW